MSLKWKLFSWFGLLMLLLLAAQWWLVGQMSARALEDFGAEAIRISRDMAEFFSRELDSLGPGRMVVDERTESEGGAVVQQRELRVIERRPGERQPVDTGREDASAPGLESLRFDSEATPGQTEFTLTLQGPRSQKKIRISSDQVAESSRQLSRRLLAGTLGLLLAGLALGAVLANSVARPLEGLAATAQRVARGEFGVRVEQRGSSREIRQAVEAFNRMSGQLEQYRTELQALEQEKQLAELGEIARGLAHTIRNPLNTLGLALEELTERVGADDPRGAELAQRADRQIRRIDRWVRSLLSMTSAGGELTAPHSVGELLEDLALELSQSGSCRLEVVAAAGTLPVRGIEAELRGMLQALLENAVEAAGPGGAVQARVDSAGDGRVQVSIEDDGPGLPEEVRGKLFSPHVTTKPQGAGMGLYLTERLARTRYGGSLRLDSAGKGAKAVLELGDRQVREAQES